MGIVRNHRAPGRGQKQKFHDIEPPIAVAFCIGGFTLNSQYLRAFHSQKGRAKKRGIGWELTFEQWLEFWGSDIGRRGSGRYDLQMQRLADTGPYAIGNIHKGTPARNSKTFGVMERNRASARAAAQLQARMDAMMAAPSSPAYDEESEGDEEATSSRFGNRVRTSWPGSPCRRP